MRKKNGARLAIGTLVLGLLAAACGGEEAARSTPAQRASAATPVTAQPVTAVPVMDRQPVVERRVPAAVTYGDAESVYRSRRYADAAEMFGVYVQSHPDNGWGHYMLGLSAWKAGDGERAIEALQRAVELDSTNTKARLNLARVLLEQERADDALVQLESARALEPESGAVRRVLGNALSELQRPEEALVAYREALTIDPEDAWSMNNYALQLIRLGRFEEALPPLARAVELMPGSALFQNNLGIALERTGDTGGASAAYAAAVAADSSHSRARVNLERVSRLAGATVEATTDLPVLALEFVHEMTHWAAPESPEVGVK